MVSEREIGPGPARNTGVGLAETEMIACVDADCIADSRWIESASNALARSEEHTSELQSLMRISYAVFCLTKKTINNAQKKTYNYDKHTKQHTNLTPTDN